MTNKLITAAREYLEAVEKDKIRKENAVTKWNVYFKSKDYLSKADLLSITYKYSKKPNLDYYDNI
jgi:hypothetical protein